MNVRVYHVKCRGAAKKYGRAANGTQRYLCKACRTTFVEKPSDYVSPPDRLPVKARQEINGLLSTGYSLREVQRRTGRHQETLAKYRQGEPNCGCGRNGGHGGWCDFRLADAPIRQAYYALMRQGGNKRLKYMRPLQYAVEQIVPKSVPVEIREEVVQDLIVLLMSGKTTIQAAKNNVTRFVSSGWKNSALSRWNLSLDAPIGSEEESTTWAEMLSDNGEQARQIESEAEAFNEMDFGIAV